MEDYNMKNKVTLHDLQNEAQALYEKKQFVLRYTVSNKGDEVLDLSQNLDEPYKTVYEKTKINCGNFLLSNTIWNKVNVYSYENIEVIYLLFEVYFEEEIYPSVISCCEYNGVGYKLEIFSSKTSTVE